MFKNVFLKLGKDIKLVFFFLRQVWCYWCLAAHFWDAVITTIITIKSKQSATLSRLLFVASTGLGATEIGWIYSLYLSRDRIYNRLFQLYCYKVRRRKSFIPHAIILST